MVLVRLQDTIAGISAGVIGTLLGYPLDYIKTRMQISNLPMISTTVTIYRENGFIGFYRGVASPLLALTILNALNFSSYQALRRSLGVDESNILKGGIDFRVGLAGAVAGPCASLISTPFELVKTQMQLQQKVTKGAVKFKNSFDCAVKILRGQGLRALYRGHFVNTVRECVFLSSYFFAYEHMKVRISSHLSLSLSIPLAGGFAGALGWFISFPLDNIKSNIQCTPGSYTSTLSAATMLLRKRGIRGMYAGVSPSIARAFLVSSARFTAYETVLWLFGSCKE